MMMMINIMEWNFLCSVYPSSAQYWGFPFCNTCTLLGVKDLLFILGDPWKILDLPKRGISTESVCRLAKSHGGNSWPEAHALFSKERKGQTASLSGFVSAPWCWLGLHGAPGGGVLTSLLYTWSSQLQFPLRPPLISEFIYSSPLSSSDSSLVFQWGMSEMTSFFF